MSQAAMSKPRCILPGTTYLITRRTSQRSFFLRPSEETNALFLYALALAAARFNVLIHAFVVLSNHYHIVLTDTQGALPRFVHCLNQLVAKALNSRLRRVENFWASGSYHALVLPDPLSILNRMAYTIANPVSAGLVPCFNMWPGLVSSPFDLAKPSRLVRRPDFFFRNSPAGLPDAVPLQLSVPPLLADIPLQHIYTLLAAAIASLQTCAHTHHKTFLSKKQILSVDPFSRPRSSQRPFSPKPSVGASTISIRNLTLASLRAFQAAYRGARELLRKGVRDAIFPAGTWKLRLELSVRCHPPPSEAQSGLPFASAMRL